MKLRITLSFLASIAVTSCGPSSNSKIADCTGLCSGGTTCDFTSGKCVTFPAGGGSGTTATGLPCDVAGVLAAKCISCHGATPSGGAPNSLVTRENLTAQSNLGGTVASRCVTRVKDTQVPMPPQSSGIQVSAADVAVLEGWVNAGLPGGACSSATQPTGGGAGGGSGGGLASGGGGGATGGGGGSSTGGGGGSATGGGTAAGGGSASGGGGGGTSSAWCRACTTDADCGGTNNFCLGFSFGDFCGTDCSATGTCATGQRCANIIDNTTMAVIGRNCVPVTGSTCSTGTTGGGAGGGGGTTCTTDTWANYAQNFFATQCASCHSHTGQFATKSFVVTNKSIITSRISSGSMPPNGLSSADRARILEYLSCGVP